MNFLEMLGPTAIPTIICLIFGLIMLLIEMFTPGIGAAGVDGLASLIAVVVMQLGWGNPRVALYIIAIALLIIILALIWIIRSLQRGRLSKSFSCSTSSRTARPFPKSPARKTTLWEKAASP
jgi:membrane-bound serine protease (ClpP class)